MTELTYTKNGDYRIPDLKLSEEPESKPLGKYGILRKTYDDIREKLVARGIPREQIAFIHEANTDAGRMARCTAPPAAGLDERKSILIEQARKCKSFRAIFLQRGLARGDHANHSHARQQGQDHCPMPDGTDGLRKESG